MTARGGVGARVRALRRAADLTIESLSERSGVSARSISDIERGVSVAPQARTMAALAAGLDLEPADREALLSLVRARRHVPSDGRRASSIVPRRTADFTGRRQEIAEIIALLRPSGGSTTAPAVVVISGPPGIGKSTSALEALEAVADPETPTVFADLDAFGAIPITPLWILRTLLRQMPGSTTKVPGDLDDAVRLWRAATSEHPPIVLLDNAGSESQVRVVLGGDPRTAFLVTSRRALTGLEGINRVALGPLGADDSVRLLGRLIPVDQCRDVDLAALAELCDHVPLALRIAGNRIASRPAWQAADFVDRLRTTEDRLRLLVAGDLAVESAFCISYDALDPETASLFRSLAVVDGPTFGVQMAAALAGAGVPDTEFRLEELVDLGLLESLSGMRYRLHDLLRLFASARLRASTTSTEPLPERARLRRWLLDTLVRAGSWYEPAAAPEALHDDGPEFVNASSAGAWIRTEQAHWWPALRTAAALGEHTVVIEVAESLHWFSDVWLEWGHWRELFSLAVSSAMVLEDRAIQATQLGYLAWAELAERGDPEAARSTAVRAVEAARSADDGIQLGWSNLYLGWAETALEHLDDAESAIAVSIEAFQGSTDAEGLAQAVLFGAELALRRGDHPRSVDALEQFRAEFIDRRSAHPVALVTEFSVELILTSSLIGARRPRDAVDAATRGLAIAEELQDSFRAGTIRRRRVLAHLALGDEPAARQDIEVLVGDPDRRDEDHCRQVMEQLGELRDRLRDSGGPDLRIPTIAFP